MNTREKTVSEATIEELTAEVEHRLSRGMATALAENKERTLFASGARPVEVTLDGPIVDCRMTRIKERAWFHRWRETEDRLYAVIETQSGKVIHAETSEFRFL